jgi:methionyl aminopeptidase
MQDIDQIAHALCRQYQVKPAFYKLYDFPGAICCSVNDEVVHGTPRDVPLKNGDLFTIDFGVELDGYCTDSAYTFVVGGITSPENKKFLDTVQTALNNAIAICKDGVRVGDIGHVIEQTILKGGYSVVEELGGHGIGKKVHEDPHIYNYGDPNTGKILKKGMTIAIEPIANMGKGKVITDKDKWTIRSKDGSLSAQFEHTIVIGETGGEILTIV